MCVCAQDMASSSGSCMNPQQRLCPSQGQRVALTQFLFTVGEWSSPGLCERHHPCGRGSQLGHALLAMTMWPKWSTQGTCLVSHINSLALDGKLKTDLPFETYVLNIVFKNAGPHSYITRKLHKDFCRGKSMNIWRPWQRILKIPKIFCRWPHWRIFKKFKLSWDQRNGVLAQLLSDL